MAKRRGLGDPSLEAEIDKARDSSDWNRVLNLLQKYSKNYPDSAFEHVVRADKVLQTSKNIDEARTHLNKVISRNPEFGEAFAALGFLEMSLNNQSAAYENFCRVELPSAKEISLFTPKEFKTYFLALAYRGKHEFVEKKNYQEASRIFSAVMVGAGQAPKDFPPAAFREPLEVTFACLPACYVALGQLPEAILTYRNALQAHRNLAFPAFISLLRQFAHLLLFHVSTAQWPPLPKDANNLYVPRSPVEEAWLVLLLADEKIHSSTVKPLEEDVLAILDLLVVAYSSNAEYGARVVEVCQRALAFTNGEKNTWFQLALAFVTSRRFVRAHTALKEHLFFNPTDENALLFASQLCINHLNEPEQALQYATRAIQVNGSQTAKAFQALGLAYFQLSAQPRQFDANQKRTLQLKALESLQQAYEREPSDFTIAYHLALLTAEIREIDRSLQLLGVSTSLNRAHPDAWVLLALLTSSKKEYEKALVVVNEALLQFHDNLLLLHVKASLLRQMGRNSLAIETYKRGFQVVKRLKEAYSLQQQLQQQSQGGAASPPSANASGFASTNHSTLELDWDQLSLHSHANASSANGSATRARVISMYEEDRHSDTGNKSRASGASNNSDSLSPGPATNASANDGLRHPKTLLDEEESLLWIAAAKAFVDMEQYTDVASCLQEATSGHTITADVFYVEGLVAQKRGLPKEAKQLFEKALTIHSNHVPSLLALGHWFYTNNEFLLAEHSFASVVRLDALCHEAWTALGKVLKAKGALERASECLLTALELESTSPVVPFGLIAKQL